MAWETKAIVFFTQKNYYMEIITLLNKQCKLRFRKYANGTIAMEAQRKSGASLWVITVNYEQRLHHPNYSQAYGFPFVVIKNYGDLAGIYDELEKQEVVFAGIPINQDENSVMAGMLTDKWEQIAKTQLKMEWQRMQNDSHSLFIVQRFSEKQIL